MDCIFFSGNPKWIKYGGIYMVAIVIPIHLCNGKFGLMRGPLACLILLFVSFGNPVTFLSMSTVEINGWKSALVNLSMLHFSLYPLLLHYSFDFSYGYFSLLQKIQILAKLTCTPSLKRNYMVRGIMLWEQWIIIHPLDSIKPFYFINFSNHELK